jgi:hypothetical protein
MLALPSDKGQYWVKHVKALLNMNFFNFIDLDTY